MLSRNKVVFLLFIIFASIGFLFLFKPLFFKKKEISEVEIFSIKRGRIENAIETSGRIISSNIRSIKSNSSGVIRLFKVKEGDLVKRGSLLCLVYDPYIFEPSKEIDNALSKKKVEFLISYLHKRNHPILEPLETAELNLFSLKEKYQQYKILYDEKAISFQQLKEMELSCKRAKLQYYYARRKIEEMIEKARIISAISGRIIKASCFEGEEIVSDQELFVIADLDSLKVELMVDEYKIGVVKEGQPVLIIPEASSLVLKGKIEDIGKEVLNVSFSGPKIKVISSVNFSKERGSIILGSSVKARITIESKDNVLLCPRVSLLASSEGDKVWVINERKVSLRSVVVGIEGEEMVEIVGGLKEGEKVVTLGSLELKEGDRVKIK
ncbi:MAG: efflux RND transporter periplasmic adaptor subunit [bacterium]